MKDFAGTRRRRAEPQRAVFGQEVLQDGVTRRRFLKAATFGAMGVAASQSDVVFGGLLRETARPGARARVPNPFAKDGRPLLVVVEGRDLEAMLAAGLDALGGLDKLLPQGAPVVLKPNLVKPQPYPVTTDPGFVFTLVRQLRRAGCGELIISDSPSAAGARKDRPFVRSGYFQEGKAAGVKVVAVDNQSAKDYLPVQEQGWELHSEILVDRRLLDAPIIINLPTLKRHFIPGMTCALKNFFGAVHGSLRRKAHQEAKEGRRGLVTFKKTIAEFADALRSELTIVDARSLLIKGGPTLGVGAAEVKGDVNRMLLSGDMAAAESYGAKLLKEHDQTFSPAMADDTLEYAQNLGVGIPDLKQVEVIELSVS
ncbi:MAG: DUF362 domain-containing protein [Acidobacteriota bacterium]